MDNRDAAIHGGLHSTGKYVYTGLSKVGARYIEVTDQAMTVEYTHHEIGKRAYYRFYPFKKGELFGLLRAAGFSKIEQFSDYQPGEDPEADFYQYVCVK